MKPLLIDAGILSGLEEPLLRMGPDLVVSELLAQPAGVVKPVRKPAAGIVGQPLAATLAKLLAPPALSATLEAITASFASGLVAGELRTSILRGLEGIIPQGNRSPGYPRYYDVTLQVSADSQLTLRLCDVTERLRLAQALELARTAHELALAVLRAPPRKLRMFLQGAATSMTLINTMLRLPARTQAAFGEKLDRILAEVLALRADAGDLGLVALAERANTFEQALAVLRVKPELSGDDLLPLAVRLDEMFAQITAAANLDEQRGVTPAEAAPGIAPAATPAASWSDSCERRLQALVTRIGQEHGHKASLVMLGASVVPDHYVKSVDSMLNHLVRNAVEHGIEAVGLRVAAGKRAAGAITVECTDLGSGGIELAVQDDGAGFDVERIGRIAVETGLLTAEALESTDPRALIGLIFRPGFSTAGVAGCNGRGLGMEFLRELVTRLGGTITVATKARQYTRFRIVLPAISFNQASKNQQRVA